MLDEKNPVESISNVRSTNSEMSRDKENLTLIVISMVTFMKTHSGNIIKQDFVS